MLKVSGLHSFYGNIEALRGVDLEIGAGEIVALIGANGAGKSTLLMTLCGRPQAARGEILFEGRDITRLSTFEIVRLRIAQVPEGRRIFPRMTVLENLKIGASIAAPSCRPAESFSAAPGPSFWLTPRCGPPISKAAGDEWVRCPSRPAILSCAPVTHATVAATRFRPEGVLMQRSALCTFLAM